MGPFQRRIFELKNIEVRATEGKPSTLTGYAAVFNSLSEDMWGMREKIAPGAFAETIKVDDIRALFDHQSHLILGRNTAGTLRLAEDEHGLAIEIDMPDTSTGRDLLVSVKRGDITQMSFGFSTESDEWKTVDGMRIRTLIKVKCFDVSPVTYPAYPDTEVEARTYQGILKEALKNNRIPGASGGAAGQDNDAPQGRPIELLRRQLTLNEIETRDI